jgi:hypothetical protein
MNARRCGLIGGGLLLLELSACSPASSLATNAADSLAAQTLAWVGVDAERGLTVVVEPLMEPGAPDSAVVSVSAPLTQALDLGPDERILQVHVLGDAASAQPAGLEWPDGARLRPAQPREDASPRERLISEAVGAGSAHALPAAMSLARRDYLVIGRLRDFRDESLRWSGTPQGLTLLPRRWTAAERQAVLGGARPAEADAVHD